MGNSNLGQLHSLLEHPGKISQGQFTLPLTLLNLGGPAFRYQGADARAHEREVVCALGSLWRARKMPRWFGNCFKREWDLFLVLEVDWFYPVRHRRLEPSSIYQTCILLSDREHLAIVIADGDPEKAEALLNSRFDEFWRAVIPPGEILPYQTVWARRRRALAILARLIDRPSSLSPS